MRDARSSCPSLASPLVAVGPPLGLAPERPASGSGPLRAEMLAGGGLLLSRNTLAPSGPAYLGLASRRDVPRTSSRRSGPSRAPPTTSAELGSFLHEPRAGARSFDAGVVAWAILRTGRDAGGLDVPGMDGAGPRRRRSARGPLAALVVGPPWTQGAASWTGTPCELLVRDDAPWLVEVAPRPRGARSRPLRTR